MIPRRTIRFREGDSGESTVHVGTGCTLLLLLACLAWTILRTAVRGQEASASDKRVHFGLGKQTVQKIEIRWPSGLRQTVKDVHADQILQIDEPATRSPVMERP